jgi:hypothetical protein
MSAGNPVTAGLLKALTLGNAIQHQRMQQERLDLEKQRMKRGNEQQDLHTQIQLMQAGAEPVAKDSYRDQQMPVPNMSPLPGQMPMDSVTARVPVNPGRTVRTSQGKEFYVPTRNELFQDDFGRRVQQLAAESKIRTDSAIAQIGARNAGAADMAVLNATLRGALQDDQQAFTAGQNEKSAKARKEIADASNASRERASKASIASREKVASQREAGANARAEKRQTGKGKDQTNAVSAIQREEDKYHGEKIRLGEMLKSNTLDEAQAAKAHARLGELDQLIAGAQSRKTGLSGNRSISVPESRGDAGGAPRTYADYKKQKGLK